MSKTQELEVGTSFSFVGPEEASPLEHVTGALSHFAGEAVLQTKLAVFDMLNGTELRQTRNEWRRIERIERMANKVGLVAINK